MKRVNVQVANVVRVVSNGAIKGHKWFRLVDSNGKIYTGQAKYIKRLALAKYNALINL